MEENRLGKREVIRSEGRSHRMEETVWLGDEGLAGAWGTPVLTPAQGGRGADQVGWEGAAVWWEEAQQG